MWTRRFQTSRGDGPELRIESRTFTVTGSTLNLGPGYILVAAINAAATFDAGQLSTFADGILTGGYEVWTTGLPATLRFRGARISELRDARVTLQGALTRVVDENGADALAQLARIDAASTLSLAGRHLVTSSAFTNDGSLLLDGGTDFTAGGGSTNFDAATRTLAGGEFSVGGGNAEAAMDQPPRGRSLCSSPAGRGGSAVDGSCCPMKRTRSAQFTHSARGA